MTNRKLESIAPHVEETIRCLQPYAGAVGLNLSFDASAFWNLNKFCNIDKHRYLNLLFVEPNGTVKKSSEKIYCHFRHQTINRHFKELQPWEELWKIQFCSTWPALNSK